eukprot:2192205-Rhodomonas_salina.1
MPLHGSSRLFMTRRDSSRLPLQARSSSSAGRAHPPPRSSSPSFCASSPSRLHARPKLHYPPTRTRYTLLQRAVLPLRLFALLVTADAPVLLQDNVLRTDVLWRHELY